MSASESTILGYGVSMAWERIRGSLFAFVLFPEDFFQRQPEAEAEATLPAKTKEANTQSGTMNT